ncbi:MAG: hypothetical protein L0922_02575, partial [Candidatus Mariimomonas ferrooxydans]
MDLPFFHWTGKLTIKVAPFPSTLPQPSLTALVLHTTSTITHSPWAPHYLNHHSQVLHTTSSITHTTHSTLPQPSLT